MLLAALKLSKRVLFVAVVYHQHVPVYKQVDVLLVES